MVFGSNALAEHKNSQHTKQTLLFCVLAELWYNYQTIKSLENISCQNHVQRRPNLGRDFILPHNPQFA